ncbi:hypothetical protein GUJ93_ZPchr0043g16398 [Zizania palustris]|uniref:Myb/SANT-like domain-containing protein n=1 Tax=Zizania palustris TaxID=103762 RepID=A0A8J5QVR5_ZIZPA|nr:hypothetical protein GUJ93_ZPchr0043g16398 [Zizania palustris]
MALALARRRLPQPRLPQLLLRRRMALAREAMALALARRRLPQPRLRRRAWPGGGSSSRRAWPGSGSRRRAWPGGGSRRHASAGAHGQAAAPRAGAHGAGAGQAAAAHGAGQVAAAHAPGQGTAALGQDTVAEDFHGTKRGRVSKKKDEQGDQMEWTDAYMTLFCELMVEQVKKGNRPNTSLNTVGYKEVSHRFFQMTGIELSKLQIKNKWDKLKIDWNVWNKLMRSQTGTGWNNEKRVIDMPNEWWKKAKKDIPGCGKFRKKAIQNEELLREMFVGIINNEDDHWNPMSDNPIIPPQQVETIDVDNDVVGGVKISMMIPPFMLTFLVCHHLNVNMRCMRFLL